MENIHNLVLTVGIIALSLYSLKLSHDNIMAIERMNQQIQMMFVKS